MQSLTEVYRLEGETPIDGNDGFDPYAALQLDPSAPHSLVEAAYWLLARRSRESPTARWLADLNRAYAALCEPKVNAASQNHARGERTSGASTGGSIFARLLRRPHPKLPSGDYYAALHVTPDACAEIIELAYRTLSGSRHASAPTRTRVEQSYLVLGNPQRRALYDADLEASRQPLASAIPIPLTPTWPDDEELSASETIADSLGTGREGESERRDAKPKTSADSPAAIPRARPMITVPKRLLPLLRRSHRSRWAAATPRLPSQATTPASDEARIEQRFRALGESESGISNPAEASTTAELPEDV